MATINDLVAAEADLKRIRDENAVLRATLEDIGNVVNSHDLTIDEMVNNVRIVLAKAAALEQSAPTRECPECHKRARQVWLQEHDTGCATALKPMRFDEGMA